MLKLALKTSCLKFLLTVLKIIPLPSMERYGYLTQDAIDKTSVKRIYGSLFVDIVQCIRKGRMENIAENEILTYFKILKNSETIKWIHSEETLHKYGYVYLHNIDESKSCTIFNINSSILFLNPLDCITSAKSDVAIEPSHNVFKNLKIGYYKILDNDELMKELHTPFCENSVIKSEN